VLYLPHVVTVARHARVAKLADAWDLKSLERQLSSGFESQPGHEYRIAGGRCRRPPLSLSQFLEG
jgi:hypothetical protein